MKLFRLNTLLLILVCLVAAIVLLRKKEMGYWRVFILLLSEMLIVETIGRTMAVVYHMNNHLVWNIQMIIEGGFYTYIFRKIYPPGIKNTVFIIVGFLLFVAGYIVETLDVTIYMYHFKTRMWQALLITLASLGYYYNLMVDKRYIHFRTNAPFWFVNGVFFNFFANMNLVLLFDSLFAVAPLIYMLIVEFVLNVFMFSCWLYAFICRRRQSLQQPG